MVMMMFLILLGFMIVKLCFDGFGVVDVRLIVLVKVRRNFMVNIEVIELSRNEVGIDEFVF